MSAHQISGFDEASAAPAASSEACSTAQPGAAQPGCAALSGHAPLARRWLGSNIGRLPSRTLGSIDRPNWSAECLRLFPILDWTVGADAGSGSEQ